MLEVKSGEGGEESALFAGDLVRMYLRYAERRGWKAEVLDGTELRPGRVQGLTLIIRSRATDPDGVWAALKFEGGVHRVQRVPVTESQGRVHTSAAGVLVYPDTGDEAGVDDRRERPAHRRLPLLGPRRAERQHHRLRGADHPPAHRHRRVAARTSARSCRTGPARWRCCGRGCRRIAEEEAAAKASADRRSQVRTVDRSERIRTYNFPENRISDHRVGYKAYNLRAVLDGDLDGVLTALAAAERADHRRDPSRRPDVSPPAPLRLGACCEAEHVLAAAGVRQPAGGRRAARRARRRRAARAADDAAAGRRRQSRSATGGWSRAARPASRCSTCSARAVLGPVTVAVGPGVFTPRPETELLLDGACDTVADVASPLVVDLCTGSGALALAVAACRPDAVVHAVEADHGALAWARHNIAAHVAAGGTPVTLHAADVRWPDLLVELESQVDLVLCNPPYVPDGTPLPPEVAELGPARRGVRRPGRAGDHPRGRRRWRPALLRYGGQLAIEHDDTQGEAVPELLRRRRVLTDVAGAPRPGRPAAVRHRPRVVAAVRSESGFGARHPTPRSLRRASLARDAPPCRRPTTAPTPTPAAAGLAAAAAAVRAGRLVVLPTDTVYGLGCDAFSARRRAHAARRQEPRPRHAGAGARRLLVDHRRAGPRRAAHGARADRGVLAGRAVAGAAARPVAGLGPRCHQGHGDAADAAAPGGAGAAARRRADGGVQREHLRPPTRHHGRRGAEQLGDGRSRVPRRRPVRRAVASTIVDLTGDEPRILREGAVATAGSRRSSAARSPPPERPVLPHVGAKTGLTGATTALWLRSAESRRSPRLS